ncbi:NTP transferase domain-containing protein [Candidatus Curtissbacteria bacterium]|nr:NTP transferase domain-containing protein [Candidatus Curtissbacteria bacterium]
MADFSAIILAGGLGKRMESKISKVLTRLGDQPLIKKTYQNIENLYPKQIIIVANPKNAKNIQKLLPGAEIAIQKEAKGTLDAAVCGLKKVNKDTSEVGIFYGDDTAFYKSTTINKVFNLHLSSKANITFVTLEKEDPSGLGRIVRNNGQLAGIIEEKDATNFQKEIKEVNNGIYFFEKNWIRNNAKKIRPSKITGELYLTDLIGLALKNKVGVQTYKLKDSNEWHGINTPGELEEARRKLARIHFMGIAGSGAAAVAAIAKDYGYTVDGCDIDPDSAYSANLSHIKVTRGHSKAHVKGISKLVISPSVLKLDPDNPEIHEAQKLKIPQETWQEFQGKELQKDKYVISVAGAYGKSTTTAMIAQILIDASFDPTCEIGATVISWGKNYRVGKSIYYICEADEYNNNFLNYQSDLAVVLNLGWDHPDFFKSESELVDSYQQFINNIKPGGNLIIESSQKEKFTFKNINVNNITDFEEVDISLIGNFRKENAKAALTVAKLFGIDTKVAKKSIKNFKGLFRRLEFKGEVEGVRIYDDYAVQPYTIKTTANALKEKYKNQKVALVLEPHTHSRIKFFFDDFVTSLQKTNVDSIYITDIYAAREQNNNSQLALKLASEVGSKAKYVGSLERAAKVLKKELHNFGVILSMGAGRTYKFWDILNSS